MMRRALNFVDFLCGRKGDCTKKERLQLFPTEQAQIYWDPDAPDMRILRRPKDDAPEWE